MAEDFASKVIPILSKLSQQENIGTQMNTAYRTVTANISSVVECLTVVREVWGPLSDRINTQGLKITEENVLPLLLHLQMVRHSSLNG